MCKKLRVLLLDNNLAGAPLPPATFTEPLSHNIELTRADCMAQIPTHLPNHAPDVILLVLESPDAHGLETLRKIRASAPAVPVVLLTAVDDDALAAQALQAGAQECLIMGPQHGQLNARDLLRALRHAVERKRREDALFAEKDRTQAVLNCIDDAVVCTDAAGNIRFLNLAAEKMSGWPLQEAGGRPISTVLQILDGVSREIVASRVDIEAGRGAPMHRAGDSLLLRRDKIEIPIEYSVAPVHGVAASVAGTVLVFREIGAAREMARAAQKMALEMAHSAQHDYLTGLPNRMLLNDRVDHAIATAPRHLSKVAVLFLDLDGFKHINDSLGHSIGDKLLQSIAQRLLNCVRAADTVSRRGGDEFVVLLSEMEHDEDAAVSATRIMEAIKEVHSVDQHDLYVTASIGVSVYPDDGLNSETLIKNADTAMYYAKENGRQKYQFFKPAMNVRAVVRQSIKESLRPALRRREFALHYQPKIRLLTGEITGAEALIRWTHPVRGTVSPAEFIPLAEDCGLILSIGNWVLREACKQALNWLGAGLPLGTMAVNVSAMELRHENFLEGVLAVLDETGLDPAYLELELTETVLMKNAESTTSILKALRTKGVQIAFDDFGTGYSSLSHLRKFPLDALKIDQSFVHQLSTAPDETTILTAIIDIGRKLKLRVIAEGVETKEDLAFLQAHDCEEAQGYYLSRPLPPEQFAKLLQSGLQRAPLVLHPRLMGGQLAGLRR
ncbi:MAG TPA: EAL domain-containing protein [Candidatus Acidoferrales bacterium]|nr:EAL domain-containing protein [Candidatus Acidoferrales bacterium]